MIDAKLDRELQFGWHVYTAHLFLVPLLVATILMLNGREPHPNNTQLWWIPAIQAQESLAAFAFAFGSATLARRTAVLLLSWAFIIAAYLWANVMLYESFPRLEGTLSDKVATTSLQLLPPLFWNTVTLLPLRLVVGVASKRVDGRPHRPIRIVDLFLWTLIVSVAIAMYRAYVAPSVDGRIVLYVVHWASLLGLTLALLSRRHWITGVTLFVSAVAVSLAIWALKRHLESGAIVVAYRWGVVAATLIVLRFAGFTVWRSPLAPTNAVIERRITTRSG